MHLMLLQPYMAQQGAVGNFTMSRQHGRRNGQRNPDKLAAVATLEAGKSLQTFGGFQAVS